MQFGAAPKNKDSSILEPGFNREPFYTPITLLQQFFKKKERKEMKQERKEKTIIARTYTTIQMFAVSKILFI